MCDKEQWESESMAKSASGNSHSPSDSVYTPPIQPVWPVWYLRACSGIPKHLCAHEQAWPNGLSVNTFFQLDSLFQQGTLGARCSHGCLISRILVCLILAASALSTPPTPARPTLTSSLHMKFLASLYRSRQQRTAQCQHITD